MINKKPLIFDQNKFISITILLITGLTPLLFSKHFLYEFHTLKYIFFQTAVLFLLFFKSFDRSLQIKWNLLDLLIISRPIVFIILSLFVDNYSKALNHIDILLFITLYYLILKSQLSKNNQEKLLHQILVLIFIVCVLESIYGLMQYYDIDIFHPYGYRSNESPLIGTFGSENALGSYLAIGIIIGIYFISNNKLKKYKILIAISELIIISACILTYSRAAWLSCLLGMTFIFVPSLLNKVRIKKIFIIFLLILFIVSAAFIYKLNEESSKGRIYIWSLSSLMLKEYPMFGIGYGNYGYRYLDYQKKYFDNEENLIYKHKACSIKDAHSEVIHSFAETGIFGTIIFLSIIILFLLNSKQSFLNKKVLSLDRILYAIAIIILCHSLLDNVLHFLPIAIVMYTIIAYFSANTLNNENSTRLTYRSLITFKINSRWLMIIISILLLVLNGFILTKRTFGEIDWKKGQDSIQQRDWDKGIDYYQKALNYLPNKGELQFHLGAAYSFTGNSVKAVEYLTRSLEDYNDKNIYISLGNAYWSQKEYKKAEDQFRLVIGMFPQMLAPHFWLATLYYDMGEIGKSIEELKYIIDAQPKILSKEVRSIKNDAFLLLEQILSL